MVYVVERYLPGLTRAELLQGLARLERTSEARYLGSTVVLEDEACFCQFEAASEAAVAEANRRAGLSFDRIVPALTVEPTERRIPMNVLAHPTTVSPRRIRLGGLIAVAAIVGVAAWAIATYAFGTSTPAAGSGHPSTASVLKSLSPQDRGYVEAITALTPRQLATSFGTGPAPLASLTPSERRYVLGIATMTPVELAAAFGTTAREAAVLSSLTPAERRYVEGVAALTPVQLAAAFGTSR